MLRHLFIISYDIKCARRRAQVLKAVKVHASGGQKSFYEAWLTVGELQQTMHAIRTRIDSDEDRVFFVGLDPRATVATLGTGVAPADDSYFYFG